MSPLLSIFSLLLLLLSVVPAYSRHLHVITIPSTAELLPASLVWDPSSQHFLVPSRRHVIAVSDAGVLQTLTLDSSISSIAAIAINVPNRRLIAASPSSVAAFDLRSPHQTLSVAIPNPPDHIAAIASDPSSPTTFIASHNRIFVSKGDGDIRTLSNSPILDNLTAIACTSRGFLLAVAGDGRIFKVDAEDGATKEVLVPRRLADAASIAFRSDGSAVVAGGTRAWRVTSEDAWAEAGVYDEVAVEGEGVRVRGATVREGRREYILVGPTEGGGWRIEEVEWPRDGEDGDMVWGLVLLGLGFAYFCYWRFQMGKLVTSVNKKRA